MILGAISPKNQKDLRSSLHPETIKPLLDMGIEIIFESGLAAGIDVSDSSLSSLGPKAVSRQDCLAQADLLLCSGPLSEDEISSMKKGAIYLGLMEPFSHKNQFNLFKSHSISAISMEFIPRITRAQKMDVLSSQSNLAGYVAVVESAKQLKSALPMMMTAAGTIAPAKVMVFGAGVAGLQAIATAKRLGAIVSATDVRMAAKEQVESLGGKFVMVEDDEAEDAETSTGYAKEMSDDFKLKQAKLISDTLASQDIAICTALIPGKKAPRLISREQVNSMKTGSVIIDLAAESGGNCECSKPGETIEENGVIVVGSKNITSTISQDASSLFSKNILNFVNILIDAETKNLEIDWEDEIIKGILITKDKKIMNEEFV